MPRFDPQATLTPQERRAEVAAILAKGVLRALEARRIAQNLAAEESSPQSQIGLDLPEQIRLSVSTCAGG